MRESLFSGMVKVVSAIVSILIALAIAELAVREQFGLRPLGAGPMGGPSPTSVTGYFWLPDDRLGFVNRPNGDLLNGAVLDQPNVRTDARGHRRGLGPTEGVPVILVAGDSFVFSAEVADDETLTSEIWRLLVQRDTIEVRNLGVRGYNTVQARRALERELERTPDVRLIVLVLCNNDFVENINPVVHFPAMAPTVRRDQQSNQVVEVDVGDFPAIWARSHAWFIERDRILGQSPSIADRAIVAARRTLALGNFFYQAMTPRPDAGVVDFVTLGDGRVGPVWTGHERWPEQTTIAERAGAREVLGDEIAAIDALARSVGASFLVTEVTYGGERWRRPTMFERIASEQGATFVSLEDSFTDAPVESYMAATATGFDGHYGPKGTKTVARTLAAKIGCFVGGPCA